MKIDLEIRCLESTDNTGFIRAVVQIRGQGVAPFSEFRDINLIPRGATTSLQFYYTPTQSGAHNVIAEIWGGAGYSWCFHRLSALFSVSDASEHSGSSRIPPGLKLIQPFKEGSFTVFTFHLEPDAVNRVANNYMVAEDYVRTMAWIVARDRWSNIDPIIMTSIGITIGVRARELHSQAQYLRGEPLQFQFRCDDTILPFIEIARAIELILGSIKILTGALMIHHLPFVPIR